MKLKQTGQSSKSESLFERLQQVYNLRVDPFSTGLPFFYRGAEREEAVAKLVHTVRFGDMTPLLTGEKGIGKTTLLAEAIKSIKDEFKVVILRSSMLMDGARFLEQLFNKDNYVCPLSFNQSEPTILAQAFHGYLKHKNKQTKPKNNTLIVVDDVDDLAEETVALILQGIDQVPSAESGVSFVFAAQPGWLSGFANKELTAMLSRLLYRIEIQPLTEQDAESYVRLRLRAAGANQDFSLSAVQLSALYNLGNGNPGRINRIAAGVVLGTHSDENEQNDKAKLPFVLPPLKQATGILLLVLVISFSCLLYLYRGDDSETDSPAPDVALSTPVTPQVVPAPKLAQGAKQGPPIEQSGSVSNETKRVDQASVVADASVVEPAANIEPEPKTQTATNVRVKQTPEVTAPAAAVPANVAPSVAPLSATVSAVEPLLKPENSQSPEHKKSTREKPIDSPPEIARPDSPGRPGFRPAEWVRSQKPSHYVVQLLGSYKETTAQRFLKRYPDSGFFYIQSSYKGKAWFVVLDGVYPTKAEARTAVANMPAKIRKQTPWIRSVKGIQ